MNIFEKTLQGIDSETIARTIDTAIGILSPETAARRAKARMQVQGSKRYYDAATRGRRGEGWRAIDAGPKEGMNQLKLLRDRARDFSRNNGYFRKCVGGIVANTIGTGIVLQLKGQKNQKRRAEDGNALWKKWAESTDCDFEGMNTLNGLQTLAFRTMVESGECFIRRRRLDSNYLKRTGKLPLQIQVMEPEFLDSSRDLIGIADGHQIISGIEFNRDGQRVAYHLFTAHPSVNSFAQSVRVPADEVIHLYRIDRPGQIRGVPWGSAAMLALRDLDLFEDAELTRRKIAACFAGFVSPPMEDDMVSINGEALANDLPPLLERIEPGLMQVLAPGEDVKFATPPNVTGYEEYTVSVLHKIAAAWEVPYSVATGDYRQVNFSSGRMGWIEFHRLIEEWRWGIAVPRLLNRVFEWFAEATFLIGTDVSDLDKEWTCPRREMIDPVKETNSIVTAIKHGLISMPEAIKEAGYMPDVVLQETADWNAELDKNKIILDSDPRFDPKRMLAEKLKSEKLEKIAEKKKAEKVASEKETQ